MDKKKLTARLKEAFSKQKVTRFLDKHGFYIVLLLCLCIIGTTALLTSDGNFITRYLNNDDGDLAQNPDSGIPAESQQNDDPIDIDITEVITGDEEGIADDSEEADNPSADSNVQVTEGGTADPNAGSQAEAEGQYVSDEKDSTALPVSGKNPAARKMVMPAEGEIIKGYSMDELVYSMTLREWATHSGIDIASPLGSEVKAAMAGVVSAIEEDALEGIVITIDHGDGLQTVYSGLSTGDMVQVGQSVAAEQVISGIGRTAVIEISDAPHLHFEVFLNGEPQDPLDYIDR